MRRLQLTTLVHYKLHARASSRNDSVTVAHNTTRYMFQWSRIKLSVYIRTPNPYYNAFVIVTMDCEMMESVLPFNHSSGIVVDFVRWESIIIGAN